MFAAIDPKHVAIVSGISLGEEFISLFLVFVTILMCSHRPTVVDSSIRDSTHFLRRYIKRDSTKINLRIIINAGYNEEETWSTRASSKNSA